MLLRMGATSKTPKSFESKLRAALLAAREARALAQQDPLSAADRLAVRTYQQLRLADTHRELLASARYGAAARFFFTELYSTKDLSKRDRDIERVISVLVKFLPDRALATLASALEMDALSESLDAALAAVARNAQGDSRPLKLSAARYAEAYCRLGRFDDRLRQIELVESIGNALDQLSRLPLLRGLLKLMKGPAHAAGVSELHAFLESGYDAFASMRGAKEFIASIVSNERLEHERLVEQCMKQPSL